MSAEAKEEVGHRDPQNISPIERRLNDIVNKAIDEKADAKMGFVAPPYMQRVKDAVANDYRQYEFKLRTMYSLFSLVAGKDDRVMNIANYIMREALW